jgi:hypothetical protein
MPSKFKSPSANTQAHALYNDEDFYAYARTVIHAGFGRGPDHARYGQDLACFATDIEARIYGNRQKVERANKEPGVWEAKRRIVAAMEPAARFPASPPSADTVRQWRKRLLPTRGVDPTGPTPPPLAALLAQVTERGVHRARQFGQFAPGVEPDFADPDPRHLLVADGTYLREYSSAALFVDPDGVEHLIRSRARTKEAAVVQASWNSFTKDGRKTSGVNHVVALTRIPAYGRVFLGVRQTLGGESHAALDLLETIIELTGDGLHGVVYDKALKGGWPEQWLMAEHGVAVISNAIRQRSDSEDVTDARIDVREALRRSGIKEVKTAGLTSAITKAIAQRRLDIEAGVLALARRTSQGQPTGLLLPLGKSEYLNSRGRIVKVDSRYYHYDTLTHALPNGHPCSHELYVDDGALWEAEWSGGKQIKVQRPRCRHAHRTRDDRGPWTWHSHWQLTCLFSGEVMHLQTAYTPDHKRGKPEKRKRSAAEKALKHMQPLARCDRGFGKIYGLRNDTESWFSWFKDRLLEDKRAASLHLHHQLLDVTYGGIITNALALRVSRLLG